MNSYILITRPEEEARALADEVRALGFAPLIEPMLLIAPLDTALPDLTRYQALVFTSANGARALAGRSEDRSHPVYCVGDATAEAARALGWRQVLSAGGDAKDLIAQLAGAKLDPAMPLLHAAGADIARVIKAPGLAIERLALYKAEAARVLSAGLLQIIDEGRLAAALFFSARTAETFTGLLAGSGRTEAAKTIKSLCLGDSVVKSLAPLKWRDVQVAARPDSGGMLALLRACCGNPQK